MGQATSLKELVHNSRARSQKAGVAAEVEAQQQQEGTFAPNVRRARSGKKRRNSMPASQTSPQRLSLRSQVSPPRCMRPLGGLVTVLPLSLHSLQ